MFLFNLRHALISRADEHTEELLCIHEEEIRRLKDERRLKGSLLASVRKYFDICEDEKELAAARESLAALQASSSGDVSTLEAVRAEASPNNDYHYPC